jgi:hypothetical protein
LKFQARKRNKFVSGFIQFKAATKFQAIAEIIYIRLRQFKGFLEPGLKIGRWSEIIARFIPKTVKRGEKGTFPREK